MSRHTCGVGVWECGGVLHACVACLCAPYMSTFEAHAWCMRTNVCVCVCACVHMCVRVHVRVRTGNRSLAGICPSLKKAQSSGAGERERQILWLLHCAAGRLPCTHTHLVHRRLDDDFRVLQQHADLEQGRQLAGGGLQRVLPEGAGLGHLCVTHVAGW